MCAQVNVCGPSHVRQRRTRRIGTRAVFWLAVFSLVLLLASVIGRLGVLRVRGYGGKLMLATSDGRVDFSWDRSRRPSDEVVTVRWADWAYWVRGEPNMWPSHWGPPYGSRYWPQWRLDLPRTRGARNLGASIGFPTWNLALPLCLLALHLYRRDRRLSRLNSNACPKCKYPLTGLKPDAPCPECGEGRAAPAPEAPPPPSE